MRFGGGGRHRDSPPSPLPPRPPQPRAPGAAASAEEEPPPGLPAAIPHVSVGAPPLRGPRLSAGRSFRLPSLCWSGAASSLRPDPIWSETPAPAASLLSLGLPPPLGPPSPRESPLPLGMSASRHPPTPIDFPASAYYNPP